MAGRKALGGFLGMLAGGFAGGKIALDKIEQAKKNPAHLMAIAGDMPKGMDPIAYAHYLQTQGLQITPELADAIANQANQNGQNQSKAQILEGLAVMEDKNRQVLASTSGDLKLTRFDGKTDMNEYIAKMAAYNKVDISVMREVLLQQNAVSSVSELQQKADTVGIIESKQFGWSQAFESVMYPGQFAQPGGATSWSLKQLPGTMITSFSPDLPNSMGVPVSPGTVPDLAFNKDPRYQEFLHNFAEGVSYEGAPMDTRSFGSKVLDFLFPGISASPASGADQLKNQALQFNEREYFYMDGLRYDRVGAGLNAYYEAFDGVRRYTVGMSLKGEGAVLREYSLDVNRGQTPYLRTTTAAGTFDFDPDSQASSWLKSKWDSIFGGSDDKYDRAIAKEIYREYHWSSQTVDSPYGDGKSDSHGMGPSELGLSHLLMNEAVRTVPYNDSLGFATVGIGHLIGRISVQDLAAGKGTAAQQAEYQKYKNGISMQEVRDLYEKDVNYHVALLQGSGAQLSQNQFDGAMSFLFQAGRNHGALPGQPPRLYDYLGLEDYSSAAQYMKDWYTPPGTAERRMRDINLFKGGSYVIPK